MGKGIETVLNLKLKRDRLEHLIEVHDWMIDAYVPENNHEHLLHCHLVGMYWRLKEMLHRGTSAKGAVIQKNYTLAVNEAEALAFVLLWGNEEVNMGLLGAGVVTDMIKSIDQKYKNNKVYGK